MPGLLPAHAKENDDGQGKPPSLPNYHRPRMNQPPGQELPRDEFWDGTYKKLVSRALYAIHVFGTFPPLAASWRMTSLWSQTFIFDEPFVSPE